MDRGVGRGRSVGPWLERAGLTEKGLVQEVRGVSGQVGSRDFLPRLQSNDTPDGWPALQVLTYSRPDHKSVTL